MSNLELIERAYNAVIAVIDSTVPNARGALQTTLWSLNSLKYAELSRGLEEITPFEAMCIAKGRYIEAIKSVRARTQLGLKDSKDIVDRAKAVWEKMQ